MAATTFALGGAISITVDADDQVVMTGGNCQLTFTPTTGSPFSWSQIGANQPFGPFGKSGVVTGTASIAGSYTYSSIATPAKVSSGGVFGNAGAASVPFLLPTGNTPYGIANSGTVTAGGAYTAGTVYPNTYSSGAYFYFPATAFSTAAAGWYWVVASSTTLFNVYTDNTATTLVVGTGSGFTGDTTARTIPGNWVIPANSIGPSGMVETYGFCGTTNSANNKTLNLVWGGTVVGTISGISSASCNLTVNLMARGVQAQTRVGSPGSTSASSSSSYPTKDTTSDVSIGYSMQLATATDSCVLESYFIRVTFGA